MSDSSATASLLAQLKDLNAAQLRRLLVEHLTRQKLGLYWESNAIERDRALNAHVILPRVVPELCQPPIKTGADDAIAGAPFENLIIEGDNFDSLRLLRATHRGKIRVIYIDPPYNTGNKDWVYNDRYVGQNDRWRHSLWLEFLYVRLTLARDLLTPDGVIMVSINDENRSRLELLMDEVFPSQRIGSMVWRKRRASNAAGVEHFFSSDHEHVLVYGGAEFSFGGSAKTWSGYSNWDEEKQDSWASADLTLGFNASERKNLFFPICDPRANVWYPCDWSNVWRYASRDRLRGKDVRTRPMEEWIADGYIYFPEEANPAVYQTLDEINDAIAAGSAPPFLDKSDDLTFWIGKRIGFNKPRFKRFKKMLKNATQPLSSWMGEAGKGDIRDDENALTVGMTSEGTKALRALSLDEAFPYPKPPSLIQGLLEQATQPGDIVLDFFAGSGTTGHAVLEINAKDGGNRRFILCSSTEATEKEPNKNICRDVCAQRMRRVMTGYGDKPGLGGAFAYLQLDATEPADVPFDASIEHARTLLSLRFAQQALPPPTKETAVQLIARGHGVDILLCMDVTDEAIAALAAWPSERIAVYSPRPETVAELLHARGRDVNSYSLYEALVQGQARAKQARAVATETTSTAA